MSRTTDLRADAPATIRRTYEEVVENGSSEVCCTPLALYTAEELLALPDDMIRMSSGCGQPVRASRIAPGSTVLDIGSGAGLDCVLAARETGPTGRVIGVDPSPLMRERAAAAMARLELDWVSFVAGTAEQVPLPDASVDVVISNCVLSLAMDPQTVWEEIARLLRPGGRFVVSDVVGGSTLETATSKARCETGVEWVDYRRYLLEAGLQGIQVMAASKVRFRDDARVQSVTLRGRCGGATRQVFVQILHHDLPGPVLDRVVAGVTARAHEAGVGYDIEILDLRDEGARAVLGLVGPEGVEHQERRRHEVFVVVDGGLDARAPGVGAW